VIRNASMQNANWKMQDRSDLSERLLEFAASSIKLTVKLKRTAVGRYRRYRSMQIEKCKY
ncbi:MAG: hypothetical protein ACPL4I_08640, partial [Bacteroidota bacterium]